MHALHGNGTPHHALFHYHEDLVCHVNESRGPGVRRGMHLHRRLPSLQPGLDCRPLALCSGNVVHGLQDALPQAQKQYSSRIATGWPNTNGPAFLCSSPARDAWVLFNAPEEGEQPHALIVSLDHTFPLHVLLGAPWQAQDRMYDLAVLWIVQVRDADPDGRITVGYGSGYGGGAAFPQCASAPSPEIVAADTLALAAASFRHAPSALDLLREASPLDQETHALKRQLCGYRARPALSAAEIAAPPTYISTVHAPASRANTRGKARLDEQHTLGRPLASALRRLADAEAVLAYALFSPAWEWQRYAWCNSITALLEPSSQPTERVSDARQAVLRLYDNLAPAVASTLPSDWRSSLAASSHASTVTAASRALADAMNAASVDSGAPPSPPPHTHPHPPPSPPRPPPPPPLHGENAAAGAHAAGPSVGAYDAHGEVITAVRDRGGNAATKARHQALLRAMLVCPTAKPWTRPGLLPAAAAPSRAAASHPHCPHPAARATQVARLRGLPGCNAAPPASPAPPSLPAHPTPSPARAAHTARLQVMLGGAAAHPAVPRPPNQSPGAPNPPRCAAATRIVTPARAAEAAAVQAAGSASSATARDEQLHNYVEAATAADLARHQADESKWALKPESWSFLSSLLGSANSARARRHAPSTRRQDQSNWKFWASFCEAPQVNTTPIRDDVAAASGLDISGLRREQDLVLAYFMFSCLANPQFKVASMLNRLRGVVRVHRVTLHLPFVAIGHVVDACKGMIQERIDDQGQECMVPQRKEPLHNWMLIAWLTLPVGLAVGQLTVGPSLAWLGVRVFICYMAITGARKADVALDAGITFGLRHLSLWHAVWDFRGVLTAAPTAAQLDSLDSNCYVYLTPVPCKNDQDGTLYSGTPTPARYSATAPINFAREFAAYERLRMVPAAERRTTPLLLGPDGSTPWRKRQLDTFFHALLRVIMPEAQAKAYSVHSFRIYLACALFAMGATPDRIMRMVRWANIASLLIYARPNAADTADWLEAASRAVIHGARSHTLASEAAANGQPAQAEPPRGSATPRASPAAAAASVAPALAAAHAAIVAATNAAPSPSPPLRADAAAPQAPPPRAVVTAIHVTSSSWLVAHAPPRQTADATAWADALCDAASADISKVSVDAVPSTDDDAVLANWHAHMATLERAARAIDDADNDAADGRSHTPGEPSDSDNDDPERA
jgi:hypothetical protein